MTKVGIVGAIILLWAVGVSAQQDPRDPGVQDSIILGDAHVDSSGQFQTATIPLFAVTDDSVGYYNIPLTWLAPAGGVAIEQGAQYFPPLDQWAEHYDSIVAEQNYMQIFGWADFDSFNTPLLITNSIRQNVISIRLSVAPNTPSQLVIIDTCHDAVSGSILLGHLSGQAEFVPAFQRGYLSVGAVGIEESPTPVSFALSQNYPNPFNPTTAIEFAVPERGRVTLEVFNLLGQRVRVLADGVYEPGRYAVVWDGRDGRGEPISSGTYFYRLTAEGYSDLKRMVLLK